MQKQNQKNQGKKKKTRKVEVSKSARIKIQKVYTCSLCPLGPCRQILASRLHFTYLRYFLRRTELCCITCCPCNSSFHQL